MSARRGREQKSPEKMERESMSEEVPFEQSHAYGLIQEYLKKEQIKRE